MKYCYSISEFTFTCKQVEKIFPESFQLERENNKNFIIVTTANLNREIFIEVQSECDRIFFLTGEQLNPELEWEKNDNGVTTHQQVINTDLRWRRNRIPVNLDKQQWNSNLMVQLRLWQFAKSPNLLIAARINLLFQIIEIAFPTTPSDKIKYYPKYNTESNPPDPKTESLLLRNLMSHGKGSVGDPQIKKYCKFLQINETMHDPIDANFIKAIKGRFNIVENEAHKVISEQITLNE